MLEIRKICNPKYFATDTFFLQDVSAIIIIFFLKNDDHTQDLRGGRNLDRRIIPAIFQSQKQSGNDTQDHEGRGRMQHRNWVSRQNRVIINNSDNIWSWNLLRSSA